MNWWNWAVNISISSFLFLYLWPSHPPTHSVCFLFLLLFLIQVKGGRVTERGTHDELMELGGVYFHLVLSVSLFVAKPSSHPQCVFPFSFTFTYTGEGRPGDGARDAWRIDETGRRIPPSCAATVSVYLLNMKRLAMRGVLKGALRTHSA